MKFPPWTKKGTLQERATKRLRYLINSTAAWVTEDGSVSAFATHCGVDRSSLHTFIARGAFSAATAVAIERAVGPDVLRAVWLTNPLEIVAE